MRILILAFLLLLGVGFAAETSTALNYDSRQSGFKFNNATQLALTSTEQNIVVTTAPRRAALVQFAPPASSANSWTYSLTTADGTKTTTVAAGQAVKLLLHNGDTVYLVSSAGVTISISCLDDEPEQ